MKTRFLLLPLAVLNACGFADTATSAATNAEAKAQEVKQARATEQRVRDDLEKANQQAEQRLKNADTE